MKNIPPKQTHTTQQDVLEPAQAQLPSGTCSISIGRKLQEYKIIMSYPLSQYLTFPYSPQYFQCIILKENVQGEEPIYHIFYEQLKKRLLSAQKQPNNIGCNYIISKKQKPRKDEYFMGKLRGNFRNNQFIIFDGGQNPKKKCVRKRKQFGFIQYRQQSLFNKIQDKMQVFVPQIQQTPESSDSHPKYHPREFIPVEQKQNLLFDSYKRNSKNVIKLSQNFVQKNNEVMLIPYLNLFKNQAQKIKINLGTQAHNSQKTSLQFSSRGKNTFSLKIGYPLNLVQGFSIALTILQRKAN